MTITPALIPALCAGLFAYAAAGTLTFRLILPHDPLQPLTAVLGGIFWPAGLPVIAGVLLVAGSLDRIDQWRRARDTSLPIVTVRGERGTRGGKRS